jgi:hypothetical protein
MCTHETNAAQKNFYYIPMLRAVLAWAGEAVKKQHRLKPLAALLDKSKKRKIFLFNLSIASA